MPKLFQTWCLPEHSSSFHINRRHYSFLSNSAFRGPTAHCIWTENQTAQTAEQLSCWLAALGRERSALAWSPLCLPSKEHRFGELLHSCLPPSPCPPLAAAPPLPSCDSLCGSGQLQVQLFRALLRTGWVAGPCCPALVLLCHWLPCARHCMKCTASGGALPSKSQPPAPPWMGTSETLLQKEWASQWAETSNQVSPAQPAVD